MVSPLVIIGLVAPVFGALPPGVQRTLSGHSSNVNAVAVSSDSRTLASGGFDRTILLWNLKPISGSRRLEGHGGSVHAVLFLPDGHLVSGGEEGAIRFWDLGSLKTVQTLETDGISVQSLANSGATLAAGLANATTRIWNSKSLRLLKSVEGGFPAISPEGHTLATAVSDHTVQLRTLPDLQLKRVLKGHAGPVRAIAFSPNGLWIATGGEDFILQLWDPASGKLLKTLKTESQWTAALAFSPDGKFLAAGGGWVEDGIFHLHNDSKIFLWETEGWKRASVLEGHASAVTALAFAPDGSVLASGSADKTVRLWRLDALGIKKTVKKGKSK